MLNTVHSSAQFFLALHPSMNFHKDMNNSPANLVKQVDSQVGRILRQTDINEIGEKARKAVAELGQDLADAKIYAQDYELSEMREEQLDNAKKAKKWLNKAQAAILRASEFNVFNAIDVAHLSAQIDQAKADLK
jgi:glyoxylate carboligase